MPNPTAVVAGVLAIAGVALAAKGWEHKEPPKYRTFGGPEAIWDIPDGQALGRADPKRLRIPSAKVDAEIGRVGNTEEGGIAVPPAHRADEASWYDGSVLPGTRGSSIIVGHYDDDKGGAVFYDAHKIRAKDRVYVDRADGTTAVFEVDALEQVHKALFPTRRVYGRVGYAGLRLVTCGGKFDDRRGHFRDNVIIYAHLTGAERQRVKKKRQKPPQAAR
ncbi:sortase family protein [Actinocorallia herbida]|uniref:Sortase family protein n=1 Tax=Actinocorallia herbida TaxID=58109 RepID=A0A3N1D3Z1_9ACTN|nr:class F sortase [Actinocorallia herbida]ROO88251.1 sortase family protein [Actinocorallia herbida]